MADRIAEMRIAFVENIKQSGSTHRWEHIKE